jgi:hypothetical protein
MLTLPSPLASGKLRAVCPAVLPSVWDALGERSITAQEAFLGDVRFLKG